MKEKVKRVATSEEIPSPYAKKWYDIGFIFAVNYIYARLAESEDPEFTQEKFREFCDSRVGPDIIKDDHFVRFPFYSDNSPYGSGQCPGDLPNTCIPCTTRYIVPIPRRP